MRHELRGASPMFRCPNLRSRRGDTRKDRDRRRNTKGNVPSGINYKLKRVLTSDVYNATRGNRRITLAITLLIRPILKDKGTPSVTNARRRDARSHDNDKYGTTGVKATLNVNRLFFKGRYMFDERVRILIRESRAPFLDDLGQ